MENNERTIKLGLEHLLEDGHEKIVYGALKKLHINTRSVEFDDFLQEARLAYAKAYVRFPQDLQENDRQFPRLRLSGGLLAGAGHHSLPTKGKRRASCRTGR
jgi:DNA-binding LacI/PurR family transcriptional regulator